jgi:hypothetical protein
MISYFFIKDSNGVLQKYVPPLLIMLEGFQICCGPAQKHQQDPLHVPNVPMTRSKIKALNALVFNQVRIERPIGVSRGDPSTSYPNARGAQYNFIWAIR